MSSTNAAHRVDSLCSRNRMKPAQAAMKPSPTTTKASTPITMYRPRFAATSSAHNSRLSGGLCYRVGVGLQAVDLTWVQLASQHQTGRSVC